MSTKAKTEKKSTHLVECKPVSTTELMRRFIGKMDSPVMASKRYATDQEANDALALLRQILIEVALDH